MPSVTTLDHGLRVVTNENPNSNVISINVSIDVGARYEDEHNNGIAHFLEHMAFKGTNSRSAQDIAVSFDNIGGIFNAATGREHTSYYAQVLHSDIDIAADIIADIIQHSVFDAHEMELEKHVILQEIAMTQDTPDDAVFELFQATAYKDQPIGRSILGPASNVQAFTQNHLHDFVSKHYHGANMILSLAGNITHELSLALAAKYFSGLTKGKNTPAQKATYHGGHNYQMRDIEQTHIVLGYPGCSYHDDDIFTYQVLAQILGGSMSSRLFQEVREKRGLAYSVSAFTSNYHDHGLFCMYAGTSPDKAQELIHVVSEQFHSMAEHISDEELQRAKTQGKASLLMAYESTNYVADEAARHLMCFDKIIDYKTIVQALDKVTKEDIARIMQTLTTKPLTSTIIGPNTSLDASSINQYMQGKQH